MQGLGLQALGVLQDLRVEFVGFRDQTCGCRFGIQGFRFNHKASGLACMA